MRAPRRPVSHWSVTVGVVLLALSLLSSPARAQTGAVVELFEDPFLCDGGTRSLGRVSGFLPGEDVQFSSPELAGVFSNRTADSAGEVVMRWTCSAPRSWTVSVVGLTSGAQTTFVVTGELAPPPPDAPNGAAFDAKSAMTVEQMAIWRDFSPFDTVGIYIPVSSQWDNRADKVQSNLSASWVAATLGDGWQLLPIYVGFQAPGPCQTARFEGMSSDPATAYGQGRASADDAVASVTSLGIRAGTPIYYDMEAYRPGCAAAVLAFSDGWTERLHELGFVSGIYGSRASVMSDLSRASASPDFDAPDAVWVSTNNGNPTSLGLEVPSDNEWVGARIHQYRLSITRTYGGVTLEIDENIVDAPAVTYAPPEPVIVDSDGDGHGEPSPDNCDTIANPDQADLDQDGDGDVCDTDIDGDGTPNDTDPEPRNPAVSFIEPTAVPEPVALDSDGDGWPEPSPDNCDTIANPDQADLDQDGDGDVCDTDIDGDGTPNDTDPEPRNPAVSFIEPTAVPEPEPEVVAEPTATPEPAAPLPTVAPVATPSPTVTVSPTPSPTVESETGGPDGAAIAAGVPSDPVEESAQSMSIAVEDDPSRLPWAVAGLSVFSVFCAGMGYRSWRRSRI